MRAELERQRALRLELGVDARPSRRACSRARSSSASRSSTTPWRRSTRAASARHTSPNAGLTACSVRSPESSGFVALIEPVAHAEAHGVGAHAGRREQRWSDRELAAHERPRARHELALVLAQPAALHARRGTGGRRGGDVDARLVFLPVVVLPLEIAARGDAHGVCAERAVAAQPRRRAAARAADVHDGEGERVLERAHAAVHGRVERGARAERLRDGEREIALPHDLARRACAPRAGRPCRGALSNCACVSAPGLSARSTSESRAASVSAGQARPVLVRTDAAAARRAWRADRSSRDSRGRRRA